jgi:hypothetical protein
LGDIFCRLLLNDAFSMSDKFHCSGATRRTAR